MCWHGTAEDLTGDTCLSKDPHLLVAPGLALFSQIFFNFFLQNAPRILQTVSKVIYRALCTRPSPGHVRLDNSLCVPEILGSGTEPMHLAWLQGSRDTLSYLLSYALIALPSLGSKLCKGWARVGCLVNECFQN